MKSVLAVFLGGGIGSTARFFLSALAQQILPGLFPYGTLAINAIGSFVLGIIMGLVPHSAISTEWRLFLAVGFCGGFTTFSTFSLEVVQLVRAEHYAAAGIYVAASLLLGIAAVFAGLWISRP